MMLKQTVHLTLLLCSIAVEVQSFLDVEAIRCWFTASECCNDDWIRLNIPELSLALNRKVYGQHLVLDTVVKHIKYHLSSDNPSKALALSFHGGTGTGKNYVSRIIAEHSYKLGMASRFVHLISSTREFPHEEKVPVYKDKLKDLIENSVGMCERSLFILDKIDKMPPGLIDTVTPYLDYDQLDGVNYRKAVFIFLSDTAGPEIAHHMFENWYTGKKREEIKLSDMERIITTAAVNTKGGFRQSELSIKAMISAYIPFLPLERCHIKQCIKDKLLQMYNPKDITDTKVQQVLNALVYYPAEEKLFSVYGCKRVPEHIVSFEEDLD